MRKVEARHRRSRVGRGAHLPSEEGERGQAPAESVAEPPELVGPAGRQARGGHAQQDEPGGEEEGVGEPDAQPRGNAPAQRHALEAGEDDVVGHHDAEARCEGDAAAAAARVAAERERKADENEDEGGQRQREALVELHVVRAHQLSLGGERGGVRTEVGEGEVALRLLRAGGAGERRLQGEIHVVEAEVGKACPPPVGGVGLGDLAVEEAQGDAAVLLVGEEAPFARDDHARECRAPLVGDDEPLESDLRGAHVLHVDGELPEGGAEDALLDPGGGTRLKNVEELPLEGGIGRRHHVEREDGAHERDHHAGQDKGAE